MIHFHVRCGLWSHPFMESQFVIMFTRANYCNREPL